MLLTDILHAFAQNPLAPAACPGWQTPRGTSGPASFRAFPGGLVEIGHAGEGFAFDAETPLHKVFLAPYRLADRLISNRDWLAFMADGGYRSL